MTDTGDTGSSPPPQAADLDRSVRWVSASKEAREAIKWLATSVGAVAAVAFGAGPLLATTTQDVGTWPWWRVGGYVIAAVAGGLGAGFVVWTLLKALVPRPVTLDQIPTSIIASLDASPETSYPGNIATFAQFKTQFAVYRTAANFFRNQAAIATGTEREELTAIAEVNVGNLKKLRVAENVILEQAGFEMTRNSVLNLSRPLAIGVIWTVLAVAVFQLLISGPAKPESAKSLTPATLTALDTDASTAFWESLKLQSCELDAGHVPVLVSGGAGTAADPYAVQTISTKASCPAITFTVTNDLALVVSRITENTSK